MLCQPAKRPGAVAPLVAASLVALMGVVAIALDGGLLLDSHRLTQAAADAAAMAAADDLFSNYATNQGSDPAPHSSKASALATASANGFNNDGVTNTVTVNIPPVNGNFASQASYAEVIIQYNQPRGFSSIFGSGNLPVVSRAVGRGYPGNIGILILDPDNTVAAQICTTININNNGQIYVNSNSTVQNSEFKGYGWVGGIYIDSTAGSPSLTCGGINVIKSSNVSPNNINAGTVPNTVTFTGGGSLQQSTTPWPDPLAGIAEPTTTGLTNYGTVTKSTTCTLQPGVYDSITITGTSGTAPVGTGSTPVVTLAPGLYYMTETNNPGLNLNGGSLQGTGVMFFLNWLKTDKFLNTANGPVNITPPNPTSGGVWPTGTSSSTYNGISIWLTRSSTQEIHVESTYNLSMLGTWYAAGYGGTGSSVGGEFDIRPDGATTTFDIGNYICDQAEWGQGYQAASSGGPKGGSTTGKSNGIINLNPPLAAPSQRPQLVE